MTGFNDSIRKALEEFTIEVPSWAYGNSGTRFRVFTTPGTPRDPFEKLADAAQTHKFTGAAPRVSLHYPWDKVEDWTALKNHADELGVKIGMINSNTFQDEEYKFGSLTNSDPAIRRRAIDHHKECIDIMRETGSKELKIWLADGTNYAGQDSIRRRQDYLAESLQEIYSALDEDHRMVLEYKFFEPTFYHTDVPDWGTSLLQCLALGEKAFVVLDTGHHAPGTNIEFIVAQLLRQGRLGAFDFNSRNYADDDLIVGAADPFQLFRILFEIVQQDAHRPDSGVNFMLDQCHNLESKIQGQIVSITNVQEQLAKALLVDRETLTKAQEDHDVLLANRILMDAFYTDVRGDLSDFREEHGLPRDPFQAFRESGYEARIAEERVGGSQMGWGA